MNAITTLQILILFHKSSTLIAQNIYFQHQPPYTQAAYYEAYKDDEYSWSENLIRDEKKHKKRHKYIEYYYIDAEIRPKRLKCKCTCKSYKKILDARECQDQEYQDHYCRDYCDKYYQKTSDTFASYPATVSYPHSFNYPTFTYSGTFNFPNLNQYFPWMTWKISTEFTTEIPGRKDKKDKNGSDKKKTDIPDDSSIAQDKEKVDKERADKEETDRYIPDKEKSVKEKSDKEKSDKEKSGKEKSGKEKSDKEKSDKEKSGKDKSDKEKSDREKADKERADREKKEKADKERVNREKADKEKAEKDKADRVKADKQKADKEKADRDKAEKEKKGEDKTHNGKGDIDKETGIATDEEDIITTMEPTKSKTTTATETIMTESLKTQKTSTDRTIKSTDEDEEFTQSTYPYLINSYKYLKLPKKKCLQNNCLNNKKPKQIGRYYQNDLVERPTLASYLNRNGYKVDFRGKLFDDFDRR